jgi:hypothetical protein
MASGKIDFARYGVGDVTTLGQYRLAERFDYSPHGHGGTDRCAVGTQDDLHNMLLQRAASGAILNFSFGSTVPPLMK